MAILRQYNQPFGKNNSEQFMKIISNSEMKPVRINSSLDMGVSDDGNSSNFTFKDEGLYVGQNLSSNCSYYFHAKVRRVNTVQTFYIKLVKGDAQENSITQYIKTIVVQPGIVYNDDGTEDAAWADIEFIFTPLDDIFDTILFELQRNSYDLSQIKEISIGEDGKQVINYYSNMRFPVFIYEEISEIQNFLKTNNGEIGSDKLLKIGVQTRPGVIMCINHEEIRVDRTGIYELYNGILNIDFFSVVTSVPDPSNLLEIQQRLDSQWKNHYIHNELQDVLQISECIVTDVAKGTRRIDAFALDYMYAG